ncbi:MAG: hypothetical protein ACK5NN_10425 [Sphingomonadaceae bacterium]
MAIASATGGGGLSSTLATRHENPGPSLPLAAAGSHRRAQG